MFEYKAGGNRMEKVCVNNDVGRNNREDQKFKRNKRMKIVL